LEEYLITEKGFNTLVSNPKRGSTCSAVPGPGTAEQVEQRLGIDTKVLNPFSVIKSSSKKFDADYLNKIGPMMMVPVGLALRSFDK